MTCTLSIVKKDLFVFPVEETSANYDIRVVQVFFSLGTKFRGNRLVRFVAKKESMSQTAPDQHTSNQKVSGVARFGLTEEDLPSGSAPTLRSVPIALVLEWPTSTLRHKKWRRIPPEAFGWHRRRLLAHDMSRVVLPSRKGSFAFIFVIFVIGGRLDSSSKTAALVVLEKALRKKRPSSWKLFELEMYLELQGAKDAVKGRRQTSPEGKAGWRMVSGLKYVTKSTSKTLYVCF